MDMEGMQGPQRRLTPMGMGLLVFAVRRRIRSMSLIWVGRRAASVAIRTRSNARSRCRGHYSDAVLSSLESQNDAEVEGITAKVKMLKDVSNPRAPATPRIGADKPVQSRLLGQTLTPMSPGSR